MTPENYILDKLGKCKYSLERLDYHPEKYLGRHIALVALKALLLYNNINLVIAALLHDICKPDAGEFKTDTLGNKYWSNKDHAKQAYEFTREWDVHKWIISMNADPDIVRQLVLEHMSAKTLLDGNGKKLKHRLRLIPLIEEFVICDDMCQRKYYMINRTIFLPDIGRINGTISYIGQSYIDTVRGDTFTITIDRTPYNYKWKDIPSFFSSNLKEYILTLL